ncbi:MAG TPA: ABC transporter substrate-binding protein [Flavobacterium sp.]|jgi:iron complex transport system substrate-binding protein
MKNNFLHFCICFLTLSFISCKQNEEKPTLAVPKAQNAIRYASGLSIMAYPDFSIVKISNPWPEAKKDFVYILKKKNAVIPDSLSHHVIINVPLQSIVVTSTTNIPYLEMLHADNKLMGFPHTDYISSVATRKRVDAGLVKNVGQNEQLNIEQLIDLAPDLIVTFAVDNNNPALENLKKSGLKVLVQGDWMEQSPLGKAEWIKLYGALFSKEKEADAIFDKIEADYKKSLAIVKNTPAKATVMYGLMYQNQWFVARGDSWAGQFLKDSRVNYLWKDEKGSGSLSLSFEKVLEKAKNADFWIAAGSFKTLAELEESNPHYNQFAAFKNKNVYTFESNLGATGGAIFYELAPSRPDLVLKDYIKIFHPELLPHYELTFANKLE